jgi:peptidyl-prolyl cis-trans isomerase SurA
VNITTEQVDAEMRRIAEGQNKVHYLVSEIFLPVDNPDQDEKVLKDAQGLYAQMQGGAPFQAIARQFSQSPSAAQGGDIGVVYDGQLAAELNTALAKMKTGDLSPPIRSTGGYFILALRQRLEPVGTKIADPSAESQTLPASLPLARLLLPLPPKTPKDIVDKAMGVAADIGSHISSCEVIPKIAAQVKGAVYMNLGMARLADLSQPIRDVLAKTEPGGVAQPFQSAAGIELFVRCDKAIIKLQAFVPPTREQVQEQLFSEQISAMARRYTRDLKRDADIELR